MYRNIKGEVAMMHLLYGYDHVLASSGVDLLVHSECIKLITCFSVQNVISYL